MSEYQYYEFQAIDRPLTDTEMGELRSYSTRGRITPTSYDQAIRLLVDLRDLDARGKGGDFRPRIEALRQAQARRPSFIERLKKAGL